MQADDNIRDDFTCKVCTKLMIAPIKMCLLGHSFCHDCTTTLVRCPLCRANIALARNYALEGLVEKFAFSCTYHDAGCDYRGTGFCLREHETFCSYSIHTCPLEEDFCCKWTGQFRNVFEHCKREHPRNTFRSNTIMLKCSSLPKIQVHNFLVEAYEKLFVLRWTVDFNRRTVNMDVHFCGSETELQQFIYIKDDNQNSNDDMATIKPFFWIRRVFAIRKRGEPSLFRVTNSSTTADQDKLI